MHIGCNFVLDVIYWTWHKVIVKFEVRRPCPRVWRGVGKRHHSATGGTGTKLQSVVFGVWKISAKTGIDAFSENDTGERI